MSTPLSPSPPLTVSGLRIEGERKRPLLSVGSLTVAPGTCVAVRGPSGAGKSTLLNALAGLLPYAAGSVCWGDTELAGLGEDARAAFRRNQVGLIFQDFLLFEELGAVANATVASAFLPRVRRAGLRERAAAVLERLGIDTGKDRSVTSFSGGERQRVAVGRALAHDPPVILADEPTASLDRAAADALITDLVGLAREQGKTLIVVSHDAAVHARMDRLIEVADGRLQGVAAAETGAGAGAAEGTRA